jgi:hypothetical protein
LHRMSPTNRALRVGVVLGGKIVEERLFRSEHLAPITFGQSLRCTISVPGDGVPMEHVLFGVDQGRYVLRPVDKMTGRVGRGSEIGELRGDVPIERDTRGKLHIGDATILFQEVAAPPIAPRPQLPASVRGTLADRVDRRLAVIVAGSLLLHLGIAGWAWMQDLAKERPVDDAVAAYEAPQYDILDLEAPDIVMPDTGTAGVAAPAKPAVQTPGNPIKPRYDQLPDPVDADRWAQVLTGNLPGINGQNEIHNKLPATDLDRQIRQITDNNQTIRTGGNSRSRDTDTRIGTGPDGPTIGDPTIDQIAKKEQDPKVRITPIPQPPQPDQPTLTINMVLARIQGQYMAGLQRCYAKHGLAIDSTMVAKVKVSFVVDETGSSTENQAHGANAEVDGCIQNQMTGWKFPVPKDKDGDPTEAPFKLQLALQPN